MSHPTIAHTKNGTPIAAWLIKCKPSYYDVMREFREMGVVVDWSVNPSYRTELFEAGQPCYLWISGSSKGLPAGVYGRGEITGGVYEGEPAEDWLDKAAAEKVHLFVELEIRPLASPILKADLARDIRFSNAEVLRVAQMSNPNVLTPDEVDAIEAWPQDIAPWSEEPYAAYVAGLGDATNPYVIVEADGRAWGLLDAQEGDAFDVLELFEDAQTWLATYEQLEAAIEALIRISEEAIARVLPLDATADGTGAVAMILYEDLTRAVFKVAADKYEERELADEGDGGQVIQSYSSLADALRAIYARDAGSGRLPR